MELKGACEYPIEKCSRVGRLYEYKNTFGELVRHYLCKEHVKALQNSEQTEEYLRRVKDIWEAAAPVVSLGELKDHEVQKALVQHQAVCERCRKVRDWIAIEISAGRVKGNDDFERIGNRVVADCCPLGAELNRRLGQVMAGQE